MQEPDENAFRKRWRIAAAIVVVAILSGMAISLTGTPKSDAGQQAEDAEQGVTFSAGSVPPLMEFEEAEDTMADAVAPGPAMQPGTIFDGVENDQRSAFYAYRGDPCYTIFAKNSDQLSRDLEGELGRRVAGSDPFPDGMILNFEDGGRLAVWLREINCKDPPYDPFTREGESN